MHPAGAGVPRWRAEHDPVTRDSGPGGALPACLPLKNRVLPANASPAPSLPRFLSSSHRFPLAPWIEMLIRQTRMRMGLVMQQERLQ